MSSTKICRNYSLNTVAFFLAHKSQSVLVFSDPFKYNNRPFMFHIIIIICLE